ncbi:peptide deformylase [Parvicella tangerina]|uniref:Peptide deformylase n=1 Tax=Parvicella tangerina TaxID=2829795 RepID=A0A916JPK6_9FLAO|nr:peptide deformylase [Parvicella tangerina]CAG5083138.1 Peptide deformylase [Parvicella tangerina]
MVLPIYAYGSPVLREECEEIEEGADISKLLEDMFETMYASQGVGLAAPQVGKALRLFIVDASPFAEDEPKDEEEAKNFEILKNFKRVFINPIIEDEEGKEWAFSEGCLSIPNIREDVTRKSVITISYFDENWEYKEEKLGGIAARIIQHEYDHIEGVLFTDYLNPLKKRLLKRKLEDIAKGKVKIGYRMNFPLKK